LYGRDLEYVGMKSCWLIALEFALQMKIFWSSTTSQCEYSWHYWSIHVKVVNFMLCILKYNPKQEKKYINLSG
jgi:hypothetical protein